jgi:hypothetical protein
MLFEKLGIVGWSPIAQAQILSGLLTNEVILLIGEPGTAKSMLIYRIGAVIQEIYAKKGIIGNVRVISVPTSNPEDWDGVHLPPKDWKEGDTMILIKTPQGLLDALVIGLDEINRKIGASSQNENKFLTLLTSREINGHKLKAVLIIAAMNPYREDDEEEGVYPLISAFRDRMAQWVIAPGIKDLSVKDKQQLLGTVVEKGLEWHPDPAVVEAFEKMLDSAQKSYQKMTKPENCSFIWNFLVEFASDAPLSLETRRLSIILRTIIATGVLLNEVGKFEGWRKIAKTVIKHAIMDITAGRVVQDSVWLNAFEKYAHLLDKNMSSLYSDLLKLPLEDRFKTVLAENHIYGPSITSTVVVEFVESLDSPAKKLAITMLLQRLINQGKLELSNAKVSIISDTINKCFPREYIALVDSGNEEEIIPFFREKDLIVRLAAVRAYLDKWGTLKQLNGAELEKITNAVKKYINNFGGANHEKAE